jgi:transposase InsO family protein
MSRKGNTLDNAPTENFFGRLKEEIYYPREYQFQSLEEVKETIHQYIRYYNEERIVNRLKTNPTDYRQQVLKRNE